MVVNPTSMAMTEPRLCVSSSFAWVRPVLLELLLHRGEWRAGWSSTLLADLFVGDRDGTIFKVPNGFMGHLRRIPPSIVVSF